MADETDKRLLHSHAHMTFMLLCPGQRGEGWVLPPKGGWVLITAVIEYAFFAFFEKKACLFRTMT